MKIKKSTFYLIFCWVFLCGVIQASNVFAKIPAPISIKNKLSSIFGQNVKTINLTEALILISKDWDPSLDETPLKNEINELITSVKNQLKPETIIWFRSRHIELALCLTYETRTGSEFLGKRRKLFHNLNQLYR